jgi:hypothetical protein
VEAGEFFFSGGELIANLGEFVAQIAEEIGDLPGDAHGLTGEGDQAGQQRAEDLEQNVGVNFERDGEEVHKGVISW